MSALSIRNHLQLDCLTTVITTTVAIALIIVLVAMVFDFTNGFHDAANSIATVVSTRVLSPRAAVIWAAVFNFVAFAIFGTRVAKTIGGDLVRIDLIRQDLRLYVLCAGLIGAIIWNLITWYLGLPTSSSHALIGGYGGAAIAAYRGFSGLLKPEGWIKTLIFIVASPVIGFVLGFALMVAVYWIFHRWNPSQVDKRIQRRDRGRGDLVRRHVSRHPCLDHTYDNWSHNRSGFDDSAVGSQVAGGGQNSVGLDSDHSGRRLLRCFIIPDYRIRRRDCG